MTRRPKILAQGPGHTRAEYLTTLAAGHETGRWNEHGVPAPWPDDFLDPHSGWHTGTLDPVITLNPGEQPF